MEPVHNLVLGGITGDPGVNIRHYVKTNRAEEVIAGLAAGGDCSQGQEYNTCQHLQGEVLKKCANSKSNL